MPTTATDTIEQLANAGVQVRLRHRHRAGHRSRRASTRTSSALISAKKDEPEWLLEWRLKAYRHWLDDEGADLGERARTRRSTTSRSSTTRRRSDEGPARRASTRSTPSSSRPTRSSASRCASRRCSPASRSTRCSTASRSRPPSRTSWREVGRHLLLVLRGGARAPRAGAASTSARWCRYTDNFFATLNSAVFSDGSFVYVPKGVRCPMELSTYFRINATNTGQFERTLIIADEGAYVSATSKAAPRPMRDENQLHAAVVELVALEDAHDQVLDGAELVPRRQGTARAASTTSSPSAASATGASAKISWTQVETGSAITWKYPSVHPQGRRHRSASSTRWR